MFSARVLGCYPPPSARLNNYPGKAVECKSSEEPCRVLSAIFAGEVINIEVPKNVHPPCLDDPPIFSLVSIFVVERGYKISENQFFRYSCLRRQTLLKRSPPFYISFTP